MDRDFPVGDGVTQWVAVDGGQSGTRLRVLPGGATGTGPGYAAGTDRVAANVEAVRKAARDAGLGGRVEVACLGLTGLPAQSLVADLGLLIAEVLDATEVRLCGDMVTAHAGALPDGYGVVVAAGTGAVCLAVDRDGSWHKIDGDGYLFGDAGSAFAIGRAGMVAMQRARDGRGPATALADSELDPVTLYASPSLVDDVARFAPTVFATAATGDAVARKIVVSAAADLAETFTTAVNALSGEGTVPVSCVGGVFAAGNQLVELIKERLPARAEMRPPAGTPLDGAVRLATGPPEPYTELLTICRAR